MVGWSAVMMTFPSRRLAPGPSRPWTMDHVAVLVLGSSSSQATGILWESLCRPPYFRYDPALSGLCLFLSECSLHMILVHLRAHIRNAMFVTTTQRLQLRWKDTWWSITWFYSWNLFLRKTQSTVIDPSKANCIRLLDGNILHDSRTLLQSLS